MSYAECWAPESLEQAMGWIDTNRKATPEFWTEGERIASMVMMYAPASCDTVVEYGCGVGRIISACDAPDLIGVDASERMLEIARDRFPDVEFKLCDGRSFPLKPGAADFVYSVLVLQHMDASDAAAVVKDVGRVLRSGGRCWMSFSGFGHEYDPGFRHDRATPIFAAVAYTHDIVRGLADEAGLRVLAIPHEHIDEYHHNHILIAEKP